MKLYALDTDIVTLFQEGHAAVRDRVLAEEPENIAIAVGTVEEQLSGWYTQLRQARDPKRLAWAYRRLAENVQMLSHFRILHFTEAAIQRAREFAKMKLRIGRFDLRIAATALEHGAILITRNARDFNRVPGLSTADWSR